MTYPLERTFTRHLNPPEVKGALSPTTCSQYNPLDDLQISINRKNRESKELKEQLEDVKELEEENVTFSNPIFYCIKRNKTYQINSFLVAWDRPIYFSYFFLLDNLLFYHELREFVDETN